MNKTVPMVVWVAISLLGAFALGYVSLNRGETINALWILTSAVCVYLIAYRFYSKFIAEKVLQLDETRMTPAHKYNDGLDYVPTNKTVLFGHHFAAIAGAGPLVGPVLAAQMGYLPGMIWILAGVVFAGAVQDFIVLFISSRRDGRSLGDLIKSELGTIPGVIALFGAFMIMVIILAVLALVVVNALAHSPWGTFTVAATLPIAIFMGVYMRFVRPGKILEISVVGFVLLILAIFGGQVVQQSPTLAPYFDYTATQLTWALVIYGFFAAVMPVWLILAPRDYLSTFLKIGTIIALAIGIVFIAPEMKMPSTTQFAAGGGPVWAGNLFPFLFITIACGAVSGFHALISSGTSPKLLNNEKDARFIGYGGMLMESFVAIMALIAASVIDPGVYFVMNSPGAIVGTTVESAAQAVSAMGFVITPETLQQITQDVGENTIISRVGGAPTLAVGMAHILHSVFGGTGMAFWYHFAILFEALFILTAVDAGTRAGRFMLQDLLGTFAPGLKRTDSLPANLIATGLCVAAWGFILYQGVIDPQGGIKSLWSLFGIANQMLAAIALTLCTVVIFKMKRGQYAWITILPTIWLLICTVTAGIQRVFSSDAKLGFLKAAEVAQEKLAALAVTPENLAQISKLKQTIFNSYLDAGLALIFMFVLISVAVFGIRTVLQSRLIPTPHSKETPYEPLPGLGQIKTV